MAEVLYDTKPAKFAKRPVVVEAIQWVGYNIQAIKDFAGSSVEYSEGDLYIQTLEGEMEASPGSWIIKGIKGEFYPCRNDIFVESYREVYGDDG